jgi:hypothetical protein
VTLPLLGTASSIQRVAPGRARTLLAAFALVALVLGVLSAVFSGIFWLVNLDDASKGYITPLHDLLLEALPSDFHALLVTLSHDASTVTPLIAQMLALAVARGSVLVLFRPERLPRALASTRGHFPFTAGYQTTWVQLGLIGTLWSFLLIGRELGAGLQDPARSVLVLVRSFDTALLSTLSGIVGAFILGPLLTGAFRARLASAGVHEESAASLVQQLQLQLTELTTQVQETSRSLGTLPSAGTADGASSLTESAAGASRALGELQGRIQQFEIQGFAGRLLDELVERLSRVHGEAIARLEAAVDQRQAATAEALIQGLTHLGQGIVSGQQELGQGLRDGLAELGAAQRRERQSEGQALVGRLAELERRLQADNQRLGKAIEERPLDLIREVEKEGRQSVLQSIAEAKSAIERGIRDLSTTIRTSPRAPAGKPPAQGLWSRLRWPWRRS